MDRKKTSISTKDFDALVESGQELVSHLDLSTARRPGLQIQRVNVDFPVWEIHALDHEASRLGITRQSLIKVWIAERLERVTVG
jgi:hypothetical protein